MKIPLAVQEILIYHDVPLLFVAKDPIGGLYLCLATDDEGEILHYISVAISPGRLKELKTNKTDLHSAFVQPELGMWFQITSFDESHAIAEPLTEMEHLPDHWLPVPGEFLQSPQGEASLLRPESFEAVKVGAVAKEAGMNPTLLRQYLSGVKRPSVEQAGRVQDALHRVAQRLLEVRFV